MFLTVKSFQLVFVLCLLNVSPLKRTQATSRESNDSSWHSDATDPYIVTSTTLPNDARFYPTLANGFVGYKLYGNFAYVSGLYNGQTSSSHRAKVPVNVPRVHWSPTLDRVYVQDMRKGTFSSTFSNKTVTVRQTIYAHLLYSRLLVSEIILESSLLASFALEGSSHNASSADIIFTEEKQFRYSSPECARRSECHPLLKAHARTGLTKVAEEAFAARQPVIVISTDIPNKIKSWKSPSRKHFYGKFISIISMSSTFDEANYFYEKGIQSVASGKLLLSHMMQWNDTWSHGSIEVKGDSFISQAITSSLYSLLSSFPSPQETYPFTFYGVSPGGLPHGGAGEDYLGHVFWDQDFWMAPGLLPLFPELAKVVLKYRARNLPGACAKADRFRFDGASYPWEAAFTGYDVCPGDAYVRNEIHVTADIIHLLKQYLYFTGDWKIFSEKLFTCHKNHHKDCTESEGLACEPMCGKKHSFPPKIISIWDMLRETSTFWMSRINWNETRQRYVINDVMGPDEWHSPVNNSAFTNVAVSEALRFSYDVTQHLNICHNLASKWLDASDRMYIPLDEVNHFHPEFDGFDYKKDIVKQADAIMLSFPLGASTATLTRNDLVIYEQATTSRGPAMTWGMFAVNWLSLGEHRKAKMYFLRQMKNIHPPFFIWSENCDGSGSANFLTGIGGFLQSVVYGYFGLRVGRSRLTLDPAMIPYGETTAEEMTLDGLNYHSLVLRISVTRDSVVIAYVAAESRLCLTIKTLSPVRVYTLCFPGQSVNLKRTKVEITVS